MHQPFFHTKKFKEYSFNFFAQFSRFCIISDKKHTVHYPHFFTSLMLATPCNWLKKKHFMNIYNIITLGDPRKKPHKKQKDRETWIWISKKATPYKKINPDGVNWRPHLCTFSVCPTGKGWWKKFGSTVEKKLIMNTGRGPKKKSGICAFWGCEFILASVWNHFFRAS